MPRPISLPNLLLASILGWAGACLAAGPVAAGAPPVTMKEHVQPVLEEYCFDCHNPKKQKGDVNLVDLVKNPKLGENREIWSKVEEAMEKGDMPPEKKPQPSGVQRDLVTHFLDTQLAQLECAPGKHPGRVTIRRLNREEFRNTVRELLHVEYYPEDFPNDEVGYGFDNIGDVLSLSPMLMEKYMAAAEQIAQKAIVTDGKPQVRKFKGNQFQPIGDGVRGDDDGSLIFISNGEGVRYFEFPAAGDYTIRIRAYGDQAGPDPVKMRVTLDGQELEVVQVKATLHHTASYEVKTTVAKRGGQKLGVAFINDYYDDKNADPKLRGDSNLYVESVELQYPPGEASLPDSHRQLIPKTPAAGGEHAAARELLAPFLKRAYRRPVTPAEVEKVAQFVDLALTHKGNFLEGMQLAVQAILCSPQFLFRWELDPGSVHPGEVRDLNDYEVASRLSYFLWNSMPDQALTDLADQGELLKNGNIEKQITRMLADWRSRALVNSFADQWLQIRNIFEISPDPNLFPRFHDDLKGMMKEETERYFEAVMKEDRSVLDLLDSNFTYLNEPLAKFYGIDGVKGREFQRVELPSGSSRGGVLTQGAVLLATSTPTRTSPVLRGKWILEQILGTPPPAPPADVPPLTEQSPVNQTASLRERFSQHSQRAECAGCHKRMDPLGFALENFDATGAWRDHDGKFSIDAGGTLPDGRKFNGARELKAILKTGDNFAHTLSEKLMIYALGRGLDYDDRCAVRAVVEIAKKHDLKFSALVTAIITSDPFLKRKTADALTQN